MRELVDADCGGANALMRMGAHFARDHALKDEGLGGGPSHGGMARDMQGAGAFGGPDQMVNEFLGQVRAVPPQTFRMDALLQEMRDIDAQQFHAQLSRAPPVIDEVHRAQVDWAKEFAHHADDGQQLAAAAGGAVPMTAHMTPVARQAPQPWEVHTAGPGAITLPGSSSSGVVCSRDFFDAKFGDQIPAAADAVLRAQHDPFCGTEFSRYLTSLRDHGAAAASAVLPPGTMLAKDFFDQPQTGSVPADPAVADVTQSVAADWAQDFEAGKQGECESEGRRHSGYCWACGSYWNFALAS